MRSIPEPDHLQELMKQENEFQERSRLQRLRYWRALVGSSLDEMLRNPDDTATCLQSQSPQVRAVALQVLTCYWNYRSEEFATVCERLAFHDPSPEVKEHAVWSLGMCYSRTDDKRVSKLLASVVRNEQEAEAIRACAYQALLLVRIVRDPQLQACLREVRFLRFPDDVNWSLVDACCTSDVI
jgi:hypothetical protein